MARIIQQQTNLWGVQGAQTEPQRSDLWVVDFRDAISGLNNQITTESGLDQLSSELEPFHILSVALPPLIVKAEEIKRDSRPYKMPAYDEPIGEVKIVLYYDSPITTASKVYKMLDTWRAFVRAGRGAMGHEVSVSLNDNYRIDFAFDITLTLLRGSSNPQANAEPSAQVVNVATPGGSPQFAIAPGVTNDLEQTAIYILENAWLSSFKISDLDYTRGNELVKLEVIFVAENILNEPIA